MNTTEYVRLPAAGVRYRVEFQKDQGHVLGFVVQLELACEDRWTPIVRYDTAHGVPHRDSYKSDGSAVKHDPVSGSFDGAFTLAVHDVRNNWPDWIERFRS